MKDLKQSTRPGNRPAGRSVSLKVRDYQVTVKVNSTAPQIASAGKSVRYSFR